MPYPEQNASFEKICFKKYFMRETFKRIYVGNNSRGEIVSRKLSRLNFSYVDRTPVVPKG